MKRNLFYLSITICTLWTALIIFGNEFPSLAYLYDKFAKLIRDEGWIIIYSTLVEVTIIATVIEFLNRKQEEKNWNGWRSNFCKELIDKHGRLLKFLSDAEIFKEGLGEEAATQWQYHRDHMSLVPRFRADLQELHSNLEDTLRSAPLVAPSDAVNFISEYQTNLREFDDKVRGCLDDYVSTEQYMNEDRRTERAGEKLPQLPLADPELSEKLVVLMETMLSDLKNIVENMGLLNTRDLKELREGLTKLDTAHSRANENGRSPSVAHFANRVASKLGALRTVKVV